MQHFLNLEKCTCGAYRYLAVREHKKSYEIYLIHHRHFSTGQNIRKYTSLASIPKFKLNVHGQRIDMQPSQKTVNLNNEEVMVLRSVLRQIESGSADEHQDKIHGTAITGELDDPSEDQERIEAIIP